MMEVVRGCTNSTDFVFNGYCSAVLGGFDHLCVDHLCVCEEVQHSVQTFYILSDAYSLVLKQSASVYISRILCHWRNFSPCAW